MSLCLGGEKLKFNHILLSLIFSPRGFSYSSLRHYCFVTANKMMMKHNVACGFWKSYCKSQTWQGKEFLPAMQCVKLKKRYWSCILQDHSLSKYWECMSNLLSSSSRSSPMHCKTALRSELPMYPVPLLSNICQQITSLTCLHIRLTGGSTNEIP